MQKNGMLAFNIITNQKPTKHVRLSKYNSASIVRYNINASETFVYI